MRYILIISFFLSACATPATMTTAPMTPGPKNTDLAVEPSSGGFLVTIRYDRFQFIPESSAVATACRSTLLSEAYHYAERQHKRIAPINEQRIQLSMGRNGFTGITSCTAQVPAEWAER